MIKKLKVIVDRKRWLRGEGATNSSLLRERDGKMCCLGFACLAAGHTEDEIRGRLIPSALAAPKVPGMEAVKGFYSYGITLSGGARPIESDRMGEAMSINDNAYFMESVRESKLIAIFDDLGMELSFVD